MNTILTQIRVELYQDINQRYACAIHMPSGEVLETGYAFHCRMDAIEECVGEFKRALVRGLKEVQP